MEVREVNVSKRESKYDIRRRREFYLKKLQFLLLSDRTDKPKNYIKVIVWDLNAIQGQGN